MKPNIFNRKTKAIGTFALTLLFATSCSDILDEQPRSFYDPNYFQTERGIEGGITSLYAHLRYIYGQYYYAACEGGTDEMTYAAEGDGNFKDIDMSDISNLNPSSCRADALWGGVYSNINTANGIIENGTAAGLDEALLAEARFFRAFDYFQLVQTFGGVPLELEEVEVPRRDYTRASREEVYNQVKQDLEDAVASLPNIESVEDGKVNKQIAQHLLAETDICLGLYDEAIAVATEIIDYPEVSLMTDRFGSRSTEEGDVYWDLFRLDNQNRSSGNKEGLWVIQYDYQNAGSSSNYDMSWALDPYYQTVMITAKDASGNDVMTTAFAGITDGKCGWGCGWMQPTEHFFTTIWEKGSENDIRNSKYNIIRDVLIDNPESPACGKWFVADGYSQQVDPIRQWYPMITKFSRVNNYPEDLYIRDSNGNPQMTVFGEHLMISSQGSYKDEYFFRLAETYLLRAEAYLMNGDKAGATADINVIRSRAHAEPATVDEVDIDYLLDERLRELYGEETRMVTLCRMGKLVERNRKYNPITGKTIEDHHNLWPIPFSEIERNTDATIEQNPGY